MKPVDKKEYPPFIFINPFRPDSPIGMELQTELQGIIDIKLLTTGLSPKEFRENLERNLVDCGGVIIIYGPRDGIFMDSELRRLRKMARERTRKFNCLAIYEGPRGGAPSLAEDVTGIQFVDASQVLAPDVLGGFLDRAVGGAK